MNKKAYILNEGYILIIETKTLTSSIAHTTRRTTTVTRSRDGKTFVFHGLLSKKEAIRQAIAYFAREDEKEHQRGRKLRSAM